MNVAATVKCLYAAISLFLCGTKNYNPTLNTPEKPFWFFFNEMLRSAEGVKFVKN